MLLRLTTKLYSARTLLSLVHADLETDAPLLMAYMTLWTIQLETRMQWILPIPLTLINHMGCNPQLMACLCTISTMNLTIKWLPSQPTFTLLLLKTNMDLCTLRTRFGARMRVGTNLEARTAVGLTLRIICSHLLKCRTSNEASILSIVNAFNKS